VTGQDQLGFDLDAETTERYLAVGLANIRREYPNQPMHVLQGPRDLVPPSTLHPIFHGSYDWHSSVHQHWMLVRLLRRDPTTPAAVEVLHALDERLTEEAGHIEAAYLEDLAHRAWERPYGWAWLLTLAHELRDAADEFGGAGADAGDAARDAAAVCRRGARALAPLVGIVRARCLAWLAGTPYPQRAGTHANSAFACTLLHDAAVAGGDVELRTAVERAADRWYRDDVRYPAWLEPSATDFLSPVLVEADLLRRTLAPSAFPGRFHQLLPEPGPLLVPAEVADRSDPQTVHLDGLNLSRAWCWWGIADALTAGDALRDTAREAARSHAAASLPAVLSGEYVGEHWLPTFATYLLELTARPV
jgi:hypothetical protein